MATPDPQHTARIDQELVARGLARSRDAARALIKEGRVHVEGLTRIKPATRVALDSRITVDTPAEQQWASRGAHKLLSALEAFEPQGLTLAGKTVLDAGASTGGFTDVCLARGANTVIGVDVGHDQLVPRLAEDERVVVRDGTNIRHLKPSMLPQPVDMVVGDLSFISLTLVLPALANCAREGADLLPMVKPQFEVGKGRVGAGGVVRSPDLRAETIREVVRCARELGLSVRDIVVSGFPGPAGNVEYFLWLTKDGGATHPDSAALDTLIRTAVEEGPQ